MADPVSVPSGGGGGVLSLGLKTMNVFMSIYGQAGFGLVVLCVIWFAMVRPTIDSARPDYEAVQKTAEALRDASGALERGATSAAAQAAANVKIMDRLEKLSDRLDSMIHQRRGINE